MLLKYRSRLSIPRIGKPCSLCRSRLQRRRRRTCPLFEPAMQPREFAHSWRFSCACYVGHVTHDDAYHLICGLARSEFDMRVKAGNDESPAWTPETWRADAEDEGRPQEAAQIAEAIRILTPAKADEYYRATWYQCLRGERSEAVPLQAEEVAVVGVASCPPRS